MGDIPVYGGTEISREVVLMQVVTGYIFSPSGHMPLAGTTSAFPRRTEFATERKAELLTHELYIASYPSFLILTYCDSPSYTQCRLLFEPPSLNFSSFCPLISFQFGFSSLSIHSLSPFLSATTLIFFTYFFHALIYPDVHCYLTFISKQGMFPLTRDLNIPEEAVCGTYASSVCCMSRKVLDVWIVLSTDFYLRQRKWERVKEFNTEKAAWD